MNSLDCGQKEYAFASIQFQNSCKCVLVKQLQIIMNVVLQGEHVNIHFYCKEDIMS
jgi:hypothetical protein